MADAKLCAVLGCEKPRQCQGFCQAHYTRWRRHGDPLGGRAKRIGCLVEGCSERHHGKGYCAVHLARSARLGNPTAGGKLRRDLSKVCTAPGCEEWAEARELCVHHYGLLMRRGAIDAKPVYSPKGEALSWLARHAGYEGDDCLQWPFGKGYGTVRINGATAKAHRHMCTLAHGEPPSPKHHAAHSCGRGDQGCINPRHLRWDTAVGNAADKFEHGTIPLGEDAWNARLTEEKVRWARSVAGEMTYAAMSQALGVHAGTIRHAVLRDTWSWLD